MCILVLCELQDLPITCTLTFIFTWHDRIIAVIPVLGRSGSWQLAGLFNQSVHGWFVSPPGTEEMYLDKLIVTTRSRKGSSSEPSQFFRFGIFLQLWSWGVGR
jgi:hypothetical protein